MLEIFIICTIYCHNEYQQHVIIYTIKPQMQYNSYNWEIVCILLTTSIHHQCYTYTEKLRTWYEDIDEVFLTKGYTIFSKRDKHTNCWK